MSDDEFWDLTPREFDALVKQWKDKQNLSQEVNACIMASLYSMFKKDSAPSKSVSDYLPFPPPPRYMTPDEAANALAAMVKRWGGQDLRGENNAR